MKRIALVLLAIIPNVAFADLELHVDLNNEEIYFLGTASGTPGPGPYSNNRVVWQEPTFEALFVQGTAVPIAGIEPPFLNFNVSWYSESVAMLSSELPANPVDLVGTGERVSYSYWEPQTKAILAASDGAQMQLVQGTGFGTMYVVIDSISPEEMLSDLVSAVVSLNVNSGLSSALDAKLQTAVAALDDLNSNNDVAAISSLYAFCNHVDAQRDKGLTDGQANQLIGAVNSIISSLDEFASLCQ